MRSQNYYEILGISRYAAPEEIRNAYELSKLTFTQNSMATYSLFSEEENEEILELISKAYETLLNPEMRREYDTFLDSGGQGSHHAWEARKPSRPAALRPAVMQGRTPAESAPGEPAVFPPRASSPATKPAAAREAPAREPVQASAVAKDALPVETRPRAAREPVARESGAGEARVKESAPAEARAKPAAPPASPRPSEVDRYLGTIEHYTGDVLKRVRDLRGISLFELCNQTKIRKTYVEYIEAENFPGLPAPVYVRGFVKLMAAALELPAEEVAQDYMSRYVTGKRA